MKGYLTIKIGLCGFLMAAVGLVNAVCVSIDRYVAPNGRKIFLFGDIHFGSQKLCKQEQDAFIAAAQERGAYCIVEDMYDYKGNDLLLRHYLDDCYYSSQLYMDNGLHLNISALGGLTGLCVAHGISCFNAEWRHDFNLISIMELIKAFDALEVAADTFCKNIDDMINRIRAYDDAGVDYSKSVSFFKKGIKSSVHYANIIHTMLDARGVHDVQSRQQLTATLTKIISLDTSVSLFDAHIVHHLYQLLLDQDDNRDIFIFAGQKHIDGIDTYMQKNLQCADDWVFPMRLQGFFMCDGKLLNYRAADRYRVTAPVNIYDYFQNGDSDQEELQRMVDLHGVDIANYFEVVTALEKMSERERCLIGSELARQELEKGMIVRGVKEASAKDQEEEKVEAVEEVPATQGAQAVESA